MRNRGFRLIGVALAATLLGLTGSGATASATAAQPRTAPSSRLSLATLRRVLQAHGTSTTTIVPAPAPLARAAAFAPTPAASSLCVFQQHGDAYGDAGLIDGDLYGIGYDCPSHTWAAIVRDPTGTDPSYMGSFALFIDRDHNLGTGCDGYEAAAVAFYSVSQGSILAGALETPNCNDASITVRPEYVGLSFPSSDTIGIGFPSSVVGRSSFGWSIATSDYFDNFDFMPDNGEHSVSVPNPPGAPGIGSVARGNGLGVVNFSRASNGGAAISSYRAGCTSSNGGTSGGASGTASPIVVHGLTNGRTYRCRVYATNAAGAGPYSAWSATFVPATTPAAPRMIDALQGNALATVSFGSPSSNGGRAITSYQAVCASTTGGHTGSVSGTGSPLVVRSLTNGHTYRCRVAASNLVGQGPFSASSAAFVPGTPSAPRAVVAAQGNGAASVSFAAPATNGGNAISGYRATCTSTDGGAPGTGTAQSSPVTVTALTNGATYTCHVNATNANATGPDSAESNAIVIGKPDAPSIGTPLPGDGQLQVVFTPPANDGGSPITSYSVECTSVGGALTVSANGTASPITVTGLTNFTNYTCAAQATSALATSDWSSRSLAVYPAFAPDAVTITDQTPGDARIALHFAPPADDGGYPITDYTATCDSSDGGSSAAAHRSSSPITVRGLDNDKHYACTVTAYNVIGASPTSAASADVVPVKFLAQSGAAFSVGTAPGLNGAYTAIRGDFDGDERSDILWYQAGRGTEVLWRGNATGGFDPGPPVSVNGSYTPVSGDFNGDGRDDILWYAPGVAPDALWYGTAGGFVIATPITINGVFTPVTGDFNNDGRTDILWYTPGAGADRLWIATASGWVKTIPVNINGVYTPIPGDFNGDGTTDILWYAPGTAGDALWYGTIFGFVPGAAPRINGRYTGVTGDFDGDGNTDLFWYNTAGADSLWRGSPNGFLAVPAIAIGSGYTPVPGDFNGDHRGDILWFSPLGADQLVFGA